MSRTSRSTGRTSAPNAGGRSSGDFGASSGSPGLGRALLFGLGGSAIGIGIYLGLPVSSGVEVSLLAVMVGYAIGKTVRRGGGGLGGTGCRIIAIALTYASLGVAYLGVEILTIGPVRQVELPAGFTTADVPAMIGLAIEMPWLRIRWSPSHVLIVGFALWQGWRLNRPRRFVVDGPRQPGGVVGAGPSPRSRFGDARLKISRETRSGDVLNYPGSPSISGCDAPPGEDAPRP